MPRSPTHTEGSTRLGIQTASVSLGRNEVCGRGWWCQHKAMSEVEVDDENLNFQSPGKEGGFSCAFTFRFPRLTARPRLHFSPAPQAACLSFSVRQHGASLCGVSDFEPPFPAALDPHQVPLHTPRWFMSTQKHGAAQLRATESP